MSRYLENGKVRGICDKEMQWGCIWIPFPGDSPGAGICYDFKVRDIPDMIRILEKIQKKARK